MKKSGFPFKKGAIEGDNRDHEKVGAKKHERGKKKHHRGRKRG